MAGERPFQLVLRLSGTWTICGRFAYPYFHPCHDWRPSFFLFLHWCALKKKFSYARAHVPPFQSVSWLSPVTGHSGRTDGGWPLGVRQRVSLLILHSPGEDLMALCRDTEIYQGSWTTGALLQGVSQVCTGFSWGWSDDLCGTNHECDPVLKHHSFFSLIVYTEIRVMSFNAFVDWPPPLCHHCPLIRKSQSCMASEEQVLRTNEAASHVVTQLCPSNLHIRLEVLQVSTRTCA